MSKLKSRLLLAVSVTLFECYPRHCEALIQLSGLEIAGLGGDFQRVVLYG